MLTLSHASLWPTRILAITADDKSGKINSSFLNSKISPRFAIQTRLILLDIYIRFPEEKSIRNRKKNNAMADTDEAAVHLPASQDSAPQIETDLSDETQDFRFLNNLAL